MKRLLILLWIVAPVAANAGAVAPAAPRASPVFTGTATAPAFSSTAASGSNGFACTTNGCRVDLGAGANDYLYSDGTRVSTAGDVLAAGNMYGASFLPPVGSAAYVTGRAADGATAVGVRLGTGALATAGAKIARFDNNATEKANVDKDGALQIGVGNAAAPPTCDATQRGKLWYKGGGAGVADTLTACCKSAADVYSWQILSLCGS